MKAGYQRRKSPARSSLSTRVRIWSRRWAPRGDQRICCFLTNALAHDLVDHRGGYDLGDLELFRAVSHSATELGDQALQDVVERAAGDVHHQRHRDQLDNPGKKTPAPEARPQPGETTGLVVGVPGSGQGVDSNPKVGIQSHSQPHLD